MIRKLQPSREPICGVFAATLATPDMPFIFVKTMAHEGMNSKARWGGRMYFSALKGLLTTLGVTYSALDVCIEKTLFTAVSALDPAKHYILFVTGHFLTLHDGKCYDQQNVDGTPIDRFWCKGKVVKAVLEIDRSKPAKTYAEMFPDE